MTRSTRLALSLLVAVAATLAHPCPAAAQRDARPFNVNKLEPSDRGSDWFTSESLDLRGSFRPAIGVVGDYADGPLVTFGANGNVTKVVISDLYTLHAGVAMNLVDRIRVAASLPIVAGIEGRQQRIANFFYLKPASTFGTGDLRFGADVRIAGVYGDAATIAVGFRAWAPNGNEDGYRADGAWRLSEGVNAAGEVGVFAWSLHVGHTYRARQHLFDRAPIGGHGAAFGATVGVKLFSKRLLVGPELAGNTLFDDPFATATTPVEGLAGAHFTVISGLRIGVAAGTRLLRGVGAPAFRGLFVVEWVLPVAPDRDGDGIIDKEDACPDVAGKRSSNAAANGCPEVAPEDRDGDGVLDKDDACVDIAGVRSDDSKTNGCPQDFDGDGIFNKDDACPATKGAKTDDPKTNGCPAVDVDSDGDGIVDKADACPREAGIKTNDAMTNGCPDNDSDKDGVANADDACPSDPGAPDPDPKKNGCPKAYIKADQIKTTDQVRFRTGLGQIVPGKDSEDVLEAVLKVLTTHPEIKKVRVEGHTDNGGPRGVYMTLSAARAASVVKWLVAHGITRDRLVAEGVGPKRPISPNTTEQGRRENRRIEFHILPSAPLPGK